MARILIDGYNLLAVTDCFGRDELISALAGYRHKKGHSITVVFDGTKGGTGSGDRFHVEGVEVLFSPITVTADDTIEDMLRKPRANEYVVVSSDRRLQSAARQAGATFVSSQEFHIRMNADPHLRVERPPWLEGRNDDDEPPRPKKGSAHKLSKEMRQRKKRLEKL